MRVGHLLHLLGGLAECLRRFLLLLSGLLRFALFQRLLCTLLCLPCVLKTLLDLLGLLGSCGTHIFGEILFLLCLLVEFRLILLLLCVGLLRIAAVLLRFLTLLLREFPQPLGGFFLLLLLLALLLLLLLDHVFQRLELLAELPDLAPDPFKILHSIRVGRFDFVHRPERAGGVMEHADFFFEHGHHRAQVARADHLVRPGLGVGLHVASMSDVVACAGSKALLCAPLVRQAEPADAVFERLRARFITDDHHGAEVERRCGPECCVIASRVDLAEEVDPIRLGLIRCESLIHPSYRDLL